MEYNGFEVGAGELFLCGIRMKAKNGEFVFAGWDEKNFCGCVEVVRGFLEWGEFEPGDVDVWEEDCGGEAVVWGFSIGD